MKVIIQISRTHQAWWAGPWEGRTRIRSHAHIYDLSDPDDRDHIRLAGLNSYYKIHIIPAVRQ